MSGRAAAPEAEAVAVLTQRLGVLLGAGVTPAAAWRHLADSAREREAARREGPASRAPGPLRAFAPRARAPAAPGTARIVAAGADAAARGGDVALAVAEAAGEGANRGAWRALAAAWSVAAVSGAPLAGTLVRLATGFRSLGQTERDVGVALAGPRATSRVVLLLPVIGVCFGMLMGFDTLRMLFGTLPGLACLAAGSTLLFAASRWNRVLLRRARRRDAAPGIALELTAIALAGGGSLTRARERVERAREAFGVGGAGDLSAIDDVLGLAARAGAPCAELLRAEAEERRRAAGSEARRRAEELAVRLMLPLGVCVLPAFMLLGVAPVLLAIVSSTVSEL